MKSKKKVRITAGRYSLYAVQARQFGIWWTVSEWPRHAEAEEAARVLAAPEYF